MHKGLTLFAFASTIAIAEPAAAASRRALLVGIADYAALPDLRNPRIDVANAAEKLRQARYEVTIVPPESNTREKLLLAIDKFLNTIDEKDTVLIYYAGHGVDIKGDNELVPADAPEPGRVLSDAVLKSRLISFRDIMQDIQDRAPAVQVWIIDACRTNPYAVGVRGGAEAGLGSEPIVTGRYVLYSADYNQPAIDRLRDEPVDSTKGSPFSRLFVGLFDKGKVKDIDLFRRDIAGSLQPLISPMVQKPIAENGMDGEWCLDTCETGIRQVTVTAAPSSIDRISTQVSIKTAQGNTTLRFDPYRRLDPTEVNTGAEAANRLADPVLQALADNKGVVYLGKKSAADCTAGTVSDLYPFGCEMLQTIRAHFDSKSNDLSTGYVGRQVTAETSVNMRRGLPRVGSAGARYGCRVRVVRSAERLKLASTVALAYLDDTFYWGVVEGPDVACASATSPPAGENARPIPRS